MRTSARAAARFLLVTVVSLVVTAGLTVSVAPSNAATMWAPRADRSTTFDPSRDLQEFESRVLIRINKVRERRGLPKVRLFHSCVDGYAESWSKKLARKGDLVHRDLRRVLGGCNLNWVGENLVSGEGLRPGDAVYAWLHSPAHRAVMLKKRAKWAGIGVQVRNGRTYAVLNLGDRG